MKDTRSRIASLSKVQSTFKSKTSFLIVTKEKALQVIEWMLSEVTFSHSALRDVLLTRIHVLSMILQGVGGREGNSNMYSYMSMDFE